MCHVLLIMFLLFCLLNLRNTNIELAAYIGDFQCKYLFSYPNQQPPYTFNPPTPGTHTAPGTGLVDGNVKLAFFWLLLLQVEWNCHHSRPNKCTSICLTHQSSYYCKSNQGTDYWKCSSHSHQRFGQIQSHTKASSLHWCI